MIFLWLFSNVYLCRFWQWCRFLVQDVEWPWGRGWTPLYTPGTELTWGDRCPRTQHQKRRTWSTFYFTSLATALWEMIFSPSILKLSSCLYFRKRSTISHIKILLKSFIRESINSRDENIPRKALSPIYESNLSRRGSWWLQENSEECSTRPAIRRPGFLCHWECNCWHVIWNFYPTADKWLFQ